MKEFLEKEFLLNNETAQYLYDDYAVKMRKKYIIKSVNRYLMVITIENAVQG